MQQAEIKLNDHCEAIRKQIDCSSRETKRLALDALDVKVYATRDSVNIQGIIPVDLVTIAQTSGYQLVWTKTYPQVKMFASRSSITNIVFGESHIPLFIATG